MCALLFYAFTTIVPKSRPQRMPLALRIQLFLCFLFFRPLCSCVCVMLAALRTSSRDSSVVDGSVQVDVAVLLDGRAEEVVTFALLLLLLKLLLFRRLLWSSRWSQMRWKCGRRLRSLSDSSEKAAADSRNCPGKSNNNNNTVVVVAALLIFLEIRAGSSLDRLEKEKKRNEQHLRDTRTTIRANGTLSRHKQHKQADYIKTTRKIKPVVVVVVAQPTEKITTSGQDNVFFQTD